MGRPQPLVAKVAAVGRDGDDEMTWPPGCSTLCSIRPVAVSMIWKDPASGRDEMLTVRGEGRRAQHHSIMRLVRLRASSSSSLRDTGRPHGVLGQRLARLDVPDSQVEIVAPGEESPAVRREADRPAAAVLPVSGQLVDLLAGRSVPQADGIVQAGRGEEPAVGRDGDGPDPVAVLQSPALRAGGGVPEADRVIVAGGGDEPARRRRDLIDRALMTGGARGHFLADSQVPDVDADSARRPPASGHRARRRRCLADAPGVGSSRTSFPVPALQQQDAAAEILAPLVARNR